MGFNPDTPAKLIILYLMARHTVFTTSRLKWRHLRTWPKEIASYSVNLTEVRIKGIHIKAMFDKYILVPTLVKNNPIS